MSNTEKTRKGFGDILDLENPQLQILSKPKQKNATFIKFSFLDLDTVDEEDEYYWNLAVRDEQNNSSRIEAMQVSYINYGWLYSDFPPCIGTDNRPRDGRTRILAAKRAGERWIIVAIFSYDDNGSPITNYISNSLACQQRPASTGVCQADFVMAGIACVNAGECLPERSAIEDLVYNELQVESFFSLRGGAITKIINKILDDVLEEGTSGGITVVRSREEWQTWLSKAGYVKGSYILLSVDNPTYAMRAWCQHLLPHFSKNKAAATIILYTNAKTGSKARRYISEFAVNLQYYYTSSFAMVNRSQSAVEIKVANPAPYNLAGAIPQIHDDHNINSFKLVDISDY